MAGRLLGTLLLLLPGPCPPQPGPDCPARGALAQSRFSRAGLGRLQGRTSPQSRCPGAGAAWQEPSRVQQSPRQLWVLPGGSAPLSCCLSGRGRRVDWYKERPDGGLDWVHWSSEYSPAGGKYSGRLESDGNFSLSISPAQREDSGVYFCSSSAFHPHFGDGTRLVVSEATEPELSLLVPVEAEEEPGQPPGSIPLLCHLRHVPPGWDPGSWQPGGAGTAATAAAGDEPGVLSAWSIARLSAEQRDGAAACPALASGSGQQLSPTGGPGPGAEGCPSWPLPLGLCGISLLVLLHFTLLLCRRRQLAGGSTLLARR